MAQTKVAWCLRVLFMSNLAVAASLKIVSFDFFAVHEIHQCSKTDKMKMIKKNFFLAVSCEHMFGSIFDSYRYP